MSNSNIYDTQKARPTDISSLPISESWKAKFHLLEKAGGVKLPKFRELSFSERMKVNFNVIAFFLGPIYYAVKGMWKKGITYFAICVVVITILSILLELAGLERFGKALGYGAAAIFAVRANIDYYKKMVLNQNGWW